MDFYSGIKTSANVVNSIKIDCTESANLFRDGLFVGSFDIPTIDKSLPVIIPFEKFGSLCVLDDGNHKSKIDDFIQACAFRILSSVNPALCNFVLYDGVGLGKGLITFAGLDSRIKGDKILTSEAELDRALEKLSDRIIFVIQNVLGSKYANSTLSEYNLDAENAEEPYFFLFINDYPHGFTGKQCRLVERITKSGPQAGIFTIISYSTEHYADSAFNREARNILNYTANIVHYYNDTYIWQNITDQGKYNLFPFRLTTVLPRPTTLSRLFTRISEQLDKADDKVIDIRPELKAKDFWKGDASGAIQVPIGKQNVTTLQYFRLGDEVNHVLIGGATGYGKSVLLHNIICNTAWLYSPEQVQMILLDYKEGTEFKVYEGLPHARVLSIQSEREYGCSVLKFINEEITRRGEAFKDAGTQDIKSYNRTSGKILPRLLIIIDEFQKLLDGDSKTANFVLTSLEDVGRRGRSFGINLILSTQSLINVDLGGVPQSLALRIVLHLNTQFDCERFLSNNNYVPYTSLSRPGQAVYNSRAGLTEGNVLFRTAFLGRKEIADIVDAIKAKALGLYGNSLAPYKRFFYDGSCTATIESNLALSRYTEPNDRFCTIFIGEPVALREEHIFYKLRRQNGSNVLIVGSDEAAAISIISYSTVQILNQSVKETRIIIADKTNADSPYFEKISETFSVLTERVIVSSLDDEIKEIIDCVHDEMTTRIQERHPGVRTVIVFNNISDIRCLRKSGYSTPEYAQKLAKILRDGPSVGIHTIIYAATYHNLSQIFEVNTVLPEFDVKIELKGGEGYRIFNRSQFDDKSQINDRAEYMANIQIGDDSDVTKLKIYKNQFDKKS